MRVVIVGASPLGIASAKTLVARGIDVVIVDRDKQKIESLTDNLDCGFVHGDGTKPAVLKETGPGKDTVLFCLTDVDQDNILAALVGRSLGFWRVFPKLDDAEFEHMCLELGLLDTMIPDRAVATTMADLVQERDVVEWSAMVKGDVRFFRFVLPEDAAGPIGDLRLPNDTKPICVYRGEQPLLDLADLELAAGDEIVVITKAQRLDDLRATWSPPPSDTT